MESDAVQECLEELLAQVTLEDEDASSEAQGCNSEVFGSSSLLEASASESVEISFSEVGELSREDTSSPPIEISVKPASPVADGPPRPALPDRRRGHRRGDSWEPSAADVEWLAEALESAKSSRAAEAAALASSLELERENAHLHLSELLISAVEQMKWRQVLATSAFTPASSAALFSPPRPFHKERLPSTSTRTESPLPMDSSGLSDDYPASEVSLSRLGSPAPSTSDLRSPHARLTRYSHDSASDLSALGSGLWAREGLAGGRELLTESVETETSAESVAQQLLANIAQLSAGRRLDAGALLVPFSKECPQELLPMPAGNEFSHARDDQRGSSSSGQAVGVLPQVVTRLHPPPKPKRDTERQGNRCAGCGRGFYLKRVRYCDYLGKWFCLVCHVGATAQIPARVLHAWDFRPYPVCDQSLQFLGNTFATPMFALGALSPGLFQRVKALRILRLKRRHLRTMHEYVEVCRVAKEVVTKDGKIWDLLEALPAHLRESEDLYSLKDLGTVRDGTLEKLLDRPLTYARAHIEGCPFCRAKGFHCLLCVERPRRDGAPPDVLFPFQSERVARCDACRAVFHSRCWRLAKAECPVCEKRRRRRLSSVQEAEVQDASPSRPASLHGPAAPATDAAIHIDYSVPLRL